MKTCFSSVLVCVLHVYRYSVTSNIIERECWKNSPICACTPYIYIVKGCVCTCVFLMESSQNSAQWRPRKRVAEPKVQTLRQRRTGPSYGRNYTVSDCKLKRGHCIYPLACLCPKPLQGGYYRAPPDEYHWYYDNRTNKCVKHTYDPAGCNNFDKFEKCETYCNNATQK
uniref:Putative bovine pancreatic trypsin inhibitor n=1 Tax=Rhipicephalus microplus TaxID=6941 RepID=A0A6G5A7G1_RHIMP